MSRQAQRWLFDRRFMVAVALAAAACDRGAVDASEPPGAFSAAASGAPQVTEASFVGSSPALRDATSATSGGKIRARVEAHRPEGVPLHDTGPDGALQG